MTTRVFENAVLNKHVLFVSTKNLDYIRNTQEIKLLTESCSELTTVVSESKSYFKRILYVYVHFIKELIKNRYDVLFIGFAPQLLIVLFPFFPKNKLLIIDFFISFYDTLIDDRKKFKDGGIVSKLLHWLDKATIHRADLVIADTKAHREYFSTSFDFPKEKIKVLYIIADTSIYQKKVHKANSTFEVIYFGSILPVQGLEVILEAMQSLSTDSTIHFTIVGPLQKKYKIDTGDYPQTTFFEWLSQEELSAKINQADLALAGHFSDTIGKAKRTIAGKTYIYKALDKPVILGDSPANHELFEPNKDNIYVPQGSSIKLAEAIKKEAEQYYSHLER